jgi:hypothetical protein
MQKLSFYDQVGIVTPGAVFLFGLMFYIPALSDVLAKNGVSLGGLGIFVIIAYAIGHLLAAVGNVIEKFYWYAQGGMPSNWVVGANPRLLAGAQLAKLEALIVSRLGLSLAPLRELNQEAWHPIFRQIYSAVERDGKRERADAFNGNYGLNRGLCAAALALAVAVLIQAPSQWAVALGLFATSLVYLYRAHRFGVHYAREVFNQFLLLPQEASAPKKGAHVTTS